MELNYFSSGRRERVLQAILRSQHRVKRVFITDPARFPHVQKTADLARDAGIQINIIKKADLSLLGKELGGQNCLSVAFAYLFPQEFLSSVALCLNVHGTLLPAYAGALTLNWVLENSEPRSGVTVHLVDAGVDTGDIVLQKSFPVSRFDTARSLARKTLDFEPGVVVEALDTLDRGNGHPTPQDFEGIARYADRRPADSELDPRRSLLELFNKIRASDPEKYPAYFWIDGEKVCVRMWRPEKPSDEEDLI